MKHKSIILFFFILSSVLVSGCWDRAELQDLDIVSMIGIDEGDDEEDIENRYRVSVQIINEGQIGNQGKGMSNPASPVTTLSATGSTIAEALRKISPQSPQELFFPHVQLMVIGEGLARKTGIQDIFDLIERDGQFRELFPVLIVKNYSAKTLLQISTPLEPLPAAKIVGGLESTKKIWGEFSSIRADQVIKQLNEGAAILTGIQINGNPKAGNKLTNVQLITPKTNIEISGLAIFKDGKLEKWLDGNAARGATWINNELKSTIINLNCPEKKKGIAVELVRAKSKIKVKIINNKPIIHLSVRGEGGISEVHCPIDLSNYKTIEVLEQQMEKEIKEEVKMALEAAKEAKTDIFRFGEYVNRKDPKLWKSLKGKWNDEIFPETEVILEVNGFIRRTGLRTKSYIK